MDYIEEIFSLMKQAENIQDETVKEGILRSLRAAISHYKSGDIVATKKTLSAVKDKFPQQFAS